MGATSGVMRELAEVHGFRALGAIGPEHALLSSDLGQPDNPHPMEGWKMYLDMFRKAGLSNADIDRMAKTNPATLLSLK